MRAMHLSRVRVIRSGFTLIEILIVVIILGILAGIVIPQFSSASHEARESTMKEDLRYLRTQITVFRLQHRDVSPGYPGGDITSTPDQATFLSQMTSFSNEACFTSPTLAAGFTFGPYLSRMPPNPLTSKTGVLVVSAASLPAPDETQPYGWIYCPALQKLIANCEGNDGSGVAYASY